MGLVTVPVALSILDTEFDRSLVTYTVLPSGVTATPNGRKPTVMVLVTVPVAVSILDTEPDPVLVTYTVLPSGVTATPAGFVPTVMVLVTVSLSPRREDRAPGTLILFWPAAAAVVCAFIGTTSIVVDTAVANVTITVPNIPTPPHSFLAPPPTRPPDSAHTQPAKVLGRPGLSHSLSHPCQHTSHGGCGTARLLSTPPHLSSRSHLNRCLHEITDRCVFIRGKHRDQQQLRTVPWIFHHTREAPPRQSPLAPVTQHLFARAHHNRRHQHRSHNTTPSHHTT